MEALNLYRDAARLGSAEALELLGDMYSRGEGVPKDSVRALHYYKEGAGKGNYMCYGKMAIHYICECENDNARKVTGKFLSGGDADKWTRYQPVGDNRFDSMFSILVYLEIANTPENDKSDIYHLFIPYMAEIVECGLLKWSNRPSVSFKKKVETVIRNLDNMIRLKKELAFKS